MHLRAMTPDDVEWAVELSADRRRRLVVHAPRFWHPADDAAERHRPFLAHLVEDPATVSLRTEHGFLIALDRPEYHLVDDMVVTDGAWPTEGAALLRQVLALGRRLRFVVPVFEEPRRETGLAQGLTSVEEWWHRDLPLSEVRAPGPEQGGVELRTDDAVGRLVPAPPIYDPSGPVLLVTRAESAVALAALEGEAAARGATVAVVTRRPGDARRALLTDAGYVQTTLYLESS